MTKKRWARRLSNAIGFDDAPFTRGSTGRVSLIGCVCSGPRLDIVVRDTVERDGDDATEVMARLVRDKDLTNVRAVMMQERSRACTTVTIHPERVERKSGAVLIYPTR